MNAAAAQPREIQVLVVVFGTLSALLVAGVLTNVAAQFGISNRVAFFALVILGFAMCGTGKLGLGAVYGWANPLHLVGYALGAIAFMLAVAVWLNLPVPFIADERAALLALAALMLVKVGVAQLYPR